MPDRRAPVSAFRGTFAHPGNPPVPTPPDVFAHPPPKTRRAERRDASVARNPNPKPNKRQNQAIRKNNTIPQSNFYSSWGVTPEVPFPCDSRLLSYLSSARRVLYINSLCLRMIMQKLENFVDSFHRATLLFGSNGFYYSTFTAHNEPQMRLPSLHVSRICHHPKPAYSSKPHQPGRGNVPVARKRTIPTSTRNHTKRQNQAIRKNSTIPQSNFYSS